MSTIGAPSSVANATASPSRGSLQDASVIVRASLISKKINDDLSHERRTEAVAKSAFPEMGKVAPKATDEGAESAFTKRQRAVS